MSTTVWRHQRSLRVGVAFAAVCFVGLRRARRGFLASCPLRFSDPPFNHSVVSRAGTCSSRRCRHVDGGTTPLGLPTRALRRHRLLPSSGEPRVPLSTALRDGQLARRHRGSSASAFGELRHGRAAPFPREHTRASSSPRPGNAPEPTYPQDRLSTSGRGRRLPVHDTLVLASFGDSHGKLRITR